MAGRKKKAKAAKRTVKRTKARSAPAKKSRKTKARKAKRAVAARKPARKAKAARKTVKKAAAPAKKKVPARKRKQIVGESDYEASRTFLKDQSDFVKENKARIPEMGKEARAAIEGSEGPALMAAEAEARGHSKNPE